MTENQEKTHKTDELLSDLTALKETLTEGPEHQQDMDFETEQPAEPAPEQPPSKDKFAQ